MESNTVLIGTTEYNYLRDFKRDVDSGLLVGVDMYEEYRSWIYTKDEAQKELLRRLRNTEAELSDTKTKLNLALNPISNKKEMSVNDIRKMSIWQFIKWRMEND